MFENLIFTGMVRHRRFTPKPHHFSYKLFMFCFDIADPDAAFKDMKHVSIEKFNWFSFRRKNYLNHPDVSLDEYARQLVAAKFNKYPKGKIYLLTHLACLGYCFNPISVYFIFDEDKQLLDYLIIEVTNTPWGEKHHYVLERSTRLKNGGYRFQFKKELHVSPFMSMNYEYQFNLRFTKQTISIHMENQFNDRKDFDATLKLTALSQNANAFKNELRHDRLITYRIVVAIYWQALKLWMKKIPFRSHPKKIRR